VTLQKAKQRAEKLRKVIDEYRYRYHVLDDPTLTDQVYDSLMEELRTLEKKYPELKTSDSPTQRIGGKPLKKFKKVEHRVRQWSLSDAFSYEELEDWEERNRKILEKKNIKAKFDYVVELKIDGLKIVLDYEKGFLTRGATRGDGVIGEKVTENIRTIKSVPLKIKQKLDLTVTGECWLPNKELKRINKERREKNLPEFANSRNAGAGSIRQLDPKIAASRNLDSYIYSLEEIRTEGIEDFKTQKEELEFLIELGFKVNKEHQFFKKLEDVKKFYKSWENKKDHQPYGIDGMVIKINSKEYQKALGYTGKSPRFAIAWKFSPEQVTTQIKDIKIQIGRTGALTPVAILKSVKVAGSLVSRATLHNEDEIIKKDIKIGDTVVIHKAGDIIPEVVEVIKKLRTGKEKKFKMPEVCPICGGSIVQEKIMDKKKLSSAHFCVNKNCFAVEKENLIHFVSKKGLNIDGLGKSIVEQLMNEGLVSSVADIFSLKVGDLESLERFAEKSAQNLIEAIEKSKKASFEKILFGLGIRHLGEEGASLLKKEIENPDSFLGRKYKEINFTIKKPTDLSKFFDKISVEDLSEINGFGSRIAESLKKWFDDFNNRKILEKLEKRGVEIKKVEIKDAVKPKKLEGKIFVLTGSLERLSRDEAKKMIKEEGGKVSSSVSSNTDYIVAGKKPGNKYEKGLELKIKVLGEKEFGELIGK